MDLFSSKRSYKKELELWDLDHIFSLDLNGGRCIEIRKKIVTHVWLGLYQIDVWLLDCPEYACLKYTFQYLVLSSSTWVWLGKRLLFNCISVKFYFKNGILNQIVINE